MPIRYAQSSYKVTIRLPYKVKTAKLSWGKKKTYTAEKYTNTDIDLLSSKHLKQ